jgi:hypothetical protein
MNKAILVVAMTALPAFAQTATLQNPPQTFVLTKDRTCSITSNNLREQFRSPGLIKGWNHLDIAWSARWDTTGCKLPMFVVVAFDYIGDKNEVVLSRYWWIKVQKEHSVPKGELSQPTKVTYRIGLVRLRDIHTVTEEQYKTEMIAEHRTP